MHSLLLPRTSLQNNAMMHAMPMSCCLRGAPHPSAFSTSVTLCRRSRSAVVLCHRHHSVFGLLPRQSNVGVILLSLGFCIGPLLDGIHSNVQLVVYENGAFNVGPLQTNLVVPPLLGIFYGVVGLSQLVLDKWFAPKDWLQKTSFKRLFFSFMKGNLAAPSATMSKNIKALARSYKEYGELTELGQMKGSFLIVILELSAQMYKAGTPYNIEAYVLFALAELNWYLFDGTWWGFGLASVVGVLCPLSEIPLMKFLDLWHYPRANVAVFDEGVVTWVLACYFAYVPFVANLSRWLDRQLTSHNNND